MAWSTPRDWTQGELVTPANMDTYISDNLSETAPAKAATAGRVISVVGANSIQESGGMVLIGQATADGTGGTMIVTSIPATYDHLRILVEGDHVGTSATLREVSLRFNGDSGARYRWILNSTADNGSATRTSDITPDTELSCGSAAGLNNSYQLDATMTNYSTSKARHLVTFSAFGVAGGGAGAHTLYHGGGIYEPAASGAITQVTARIVTDNWQSGSTLTVYGLSV